ncbi:transposase [Patescibacteria group bacterium]|nr:transposase [Patescibacteria group bacterium]
MAKKEAQTYSKEFKEQILQECIETNNYNAVARKHDIPASTVYTWLRELKNKDTIKTEKSNKAIKKELEDAKLENKILKELLKKTHQLWLKE